MPKQSTRVSFRLIRNFTEKFKWIDPDTGAERTGFNPPLNAAQVVRVPFYIRFITKGGKVEDGLVTCIGVLPHKHQRRIRFEQSGEIRIVRDYLIIEVDGVLFQTH